MIDPTETLTTLKYFLFSLYRDSEGNEVWVHEMPDAYLYLWADGNTHHSYRRPDLLGYELVS